MGNVHHLLSGTGTVGNSCNWPSMFFVYLVIDSTSLRSKLNNYVGDTTRSDIRSANLIGHRVTVIVRILVLWLVQLIIEQPLTSCYFELSCFRRLVRLRPSIEYGGLVLPLARQFVWLGHWSDASAVPKPTVLWGCARAFEFLVCKRPLKPHKNPIVRATTLKCVLKGKKMVKVCRMYGLKKSLKQSQQYPVRFCEAIALHSGIR